MPNPIFIPAKRRVSRKIRTARTPTAAAALTLVSAAYVTGTSIELTFDRAIDIAGLVGSQITVEDGEPLEIRFVATGAASLTGPASVLIELEEGETWVGAGIR